MYLFLLFPQHNGERPRCSRWRSLPDTALGVWYSHTSSTSYLTNRMAHKSIKNPLLMSNIPFKSIKHHINSMYVIILIDPFYSYIFITEHTTFSCVLVKGAEASRLAWRRKSHESNGIMKQPSAVVLQKNMTTITIQYKEAPQQYIYICICIYI